MGAPVGLLFGLLHSTALIGAVSYGVGTVVPSAPPAAPVVVRAAAPSAAPTNTAATSTAAASTSPVASTRTSASPTPAAPTSTAPASTGPTSTVPVGTAPVVPAVVVPEAAVTEAPPRRTGVGIIHAPADHTFVTLADLSEIFGAKVSSSSRVAEGLPSLNRAMQQAGITTPERKAAFLATLAYESTFDYALQEAYSGAFYRGRGYIQLTSDFNYRAAGNYLGVNLLDDPTLAASLEWSAPIAIWYWTVQRPNSNRAADTFDMGLISRYIGYGASGTQDQLRCDAFKRAYLHFSGTPAPSRTVCYRH